MKATTLFKAYQEASWYRSNARARRENIFGIAMRNDEWALEWQRYNRLICKLEARLIAILEQVDGDREDER